jgi:hypothetical protein
VAYLDTNSFDSEFMRVLKGIEANADFVKNLGESNVLGRMFEVFRAAMLCTKHPGFHEEREWRLIYTPTYRSSKHIKSDIESVAGTPQPVCKIPLADIPSEGLVDIEIPAIVDRVIIGPTQYPLVVREAFVTVLKAAGMSDAANRVIVSDIPLRN